MEIAALTAGSAASATTTAGSTTGADDLFANTLAGIRFRTEEDRAKEKALTEAADAPTGAAAAFKEYMSKPLAEKMLDAWLGKHGMTREDFEALPPAEQQKILDQMKQELEAEMKDKLHKSAMAQLGIGF